MRVDWKDPADADRLRELVDRTDNAKQRDRYRVALIAGEGLGPQTQLQRERIAAAVGRSRPFVDQWVGRYRRGGIEALTPKRQPGATPRLSAARQQELGAMLDAGPPPREGLAAYNGPILREKIRERFGVLYSLAGGLRPAAPPGLQRPHAPPRPPRRRPRGAGGLFTSECVKPQLPIPKENPAPRSR